MMPKQSNLTVHIPASTTSLNPSSFINSSSTTNLKTFGISSYSQRLPQNQTRVNILSRMKQRFSVGNSLTNQIPSNEISSNQYSTTLLPTIPSNTLRTNQSNICPWELISPSTLFHRRQRLQQTRFNSTASFSCDLEKGILPPIDSPTSTRAETKYSCSLVLQILIMVTLILVIVNLLIIDIQYLPIVATLNINQV